MQTSAVKGNWSRTIAYQRPNGGDRINLATHAPAKKFGNIHTSAGSFALKHPRLRLADLPGQFSLRQSGLFAHVPKRDRNLSVNRSKLTLGHGAG